MHRPGEGDRPTERTTVERFDPLLGSILDDRFRIEHKLAAGGFGAIYRAIDIRSDAEVALKVLLPQVAGDPKVTARFRREGKTLASLRDPHTITAYELGEAPDGTLYIVMELLHGVSLYERFKTYGQLPWRRVVHIARGVCSSLVEAHGVGIVHRDLKPANIHLETRGNDPDFVKVLDFGIAKIVTPDESSELTQAGHMIGTVDYMSPEQMVGGEMTPRSDIYTLGVVMYEMIAGRTPFAGAQSPTAMLAAVLTQTPEPVSRFAEVPAALAALIARCLEREAAHRFADVSELADALAAVAAEPVRPSLSIEGRVARDFVDPGSEPTRAARPSSPEMRALRLASLPSVHDLETRQATAPNVVVDPDVHERATRLSASVMPDVHEEATRLVATPIDERVVREAAPELRVLRGPAPQLVDLREAPRRPSAPELSHPRPTPAPELRARPPTPAPPRPRNLTPPPPSRSLTPPGAATSGFEEQSTTEATRIDVRLSDSSLPVLDARGPRVRPDALGIPTPLIPGTPPPFAGPARGSQHAIDARPLRATPLPTAPPPEAWPQESWGFIPPSRTSPPPSFDMIAEAKRDAMIRRFIWLVLFVLSMTITVVLTR